MTNIVRFDDFENSEIRVTDDGRFSVFDVIKFCGRKNPSQVWTGDNRGNGLASKYPELIHKVEGFKFTGRGQQDTPVAGKENLLYIIGLLPGTIGHSYREEAAKVFLQYLDASPELAGSVIDRATPEDLKKIKARLKGKEVRISFTSVLQDHGVTKGWQFGRCTDAIYRPILGGTTKSVKLERGLALRVNLRDELDEFELTQVMFAESLTERKIKTRNLQGFNQCEDAASQSARRVKQISDEDLSK